MMENLKFCIIIVQTEEVNLTGTLPNLRVLNNNYVVLDSRLITLRKIYRVYPEFSRLNNVVVVKVPSFIFFCNGQDNKTTFHIPQNVPKNNIF